MHPHTGVFWASLLGGGVLGFTAAAVRLSSSPLEGRRWVMVLGTIAGLILGGVVFFGLALAGALLGYSTDRTDSWVLLGPALLILLFLFVGFALRRK
ncbi:MAG: hypothetical protein AMS18_05595 [Gemmatimonas sp. SG8_17]|nr:MAG: hypothetical protein AMS18_05595 [Gemmatimonas sp. SG8_17]